MTARLRVCFAGRAHLVLTYLGLVVGVGGAFIGILQNFSKISVDPKDFQTGLRETCRERTDTINGSVPNNPYRPT
jgi:hypothetical protein